jgi:phosphoenolpyruvate carboxykinase (ATP)
MKLAYTRAMVSAALAGELDEVETREDPHFGLHVPIGVKGVPDEVLHPRITWHDGDAYDQQANKLAAMFKKNFEQYADEVPEAIKAAGPK